LQALGGASAPGCRHTLGLGDNIPISTANLNEGFVALKDGQMVMLRMGFEPLPPSISHGVRSTRCLSASKAGPMRDDMVRAVALVAQDRMKP
jgi:hypothetical protein